MQRPYDVTSDNFVGNFDTKVGTYTGNVIVIQAECKLRADKVVAEAVDGNDLNRMTATGNVVFASSSRHGDRRYRRLRLGPKTVTLTGKVVLTKGKDVMRGTRSRREHGHGNGPSDRHRRGRRRRVQSVFVPKSDTAGVRRNPSRPRPTSLHSSLKPDRHSSCHDQSDHSDAPTETPRWRTALPRVVEGSQGLVVDRIGKSFRKRPVVRSVSLSLRRGEVVGLLGPNGAGKTTCFYMITGLIQADYGTIELDGHDVTQLPMYRRARLGIGYLPQEASIFRGLTAEENIRATAELVESDASRLEAMVEELLAEFGVTHVRNTPSIALSGGERRRVEIARALATHPSYILLDEPLAGIDPIAVGEIRDLVRQLKDRGIGVLITDHNVRDALDIIDRAYIIHEGQVLKEGLPDEIVGDRDVRRVYLGERFSL